MTGNVLDAAATEASILVRARQITRNFSGKRFWRQSKPTSTADSMAASPSVSSAS
jgi:hypothetical protein